MKRQKPTIKTTPEMTDDRFAGGVPKMFISNLIKILKDIKGNMNMIWRNMKELFKRHTLKT